MKNKRLAALAVVVVALGAAPSAIAASGEFSRTVDVDGRVVLDVVTNSGSIEIQGADVSRVEITATVKVRNKSLFGSSDGDQAIVDGIVSSPPIEVSGNRVTISKAERSGRDRNIRISYTISVPHDSDVTARSGSGKVIIGDVTGPVSARTGSGGISLDAIGDSVFAKSGSGSIVAEGIGGAFEGHTGSGRITLEQVAPGDVEVSTGSGSTELQGIEGSLSASAGSGRIKVAGRQVGPWNLHTGSGSITIDVPDDAAFAVDLRTSSGSIDLGHPTTIEGKISRKRIKGEVRSGGDLIHVRTGSGRIRID